MNKAIFLDRDGTLNPDPGYISDPNDFELFPGAADALAKLKQAGFLLVLITNQSGIARGKISHSALEKIHSKLQSKLHEKDVELDAIYFCPHHPDFPSDDGTTECDCRKPKSGMVLKAIKDLNINPQESFFIGDRKSDLLAALGAGVEPVIISENVFAGYEEISFYADLKGAVQHILSL